MASLTARLVRCHRGAAAAPVLASVLGPRLAAVGQVVANTRAAASLARVGVDEIALVDGRGVLRATAWTDRGRARGVVFAAEGGLLCWIRDGAALPATKKVPPELARAVRTFSKLGDGGGAPGQPKKAGRANRSATDAVPRFVAHHARTVATAADARALPAVERAQLLAASGELCGERGVAALLAACAGEGGVELVRFEGSDGAGYDAWLTAALEDGVFFARGARRPCGLAIGQGQVHDMTERRDALVDNLQAAWRKLRVPRRRG